MVRKSCMVSASVQHSCGGNQLNECIWCKFPSTGTGLPDEFTGMLSRCAPFLTGVDGVSSSLNVICGSWQQMSTCSNTLALLEAEATYEFFKAARCNTAVLDIILPKPWSSKVWGYFRKGPELYFQSLSSIGGKLCIFLTHGWFERIRTISDYLCFWIQELWSSLCALTEIHAVLS